MTDMFYGLPITPEMEAAADARLTDPDLDDLVADHLKINYSYFGAIDKTLAGFFVLDDEGDNYTLLDVRGDGRVWWQDHETRELYVHFDSLDDWLSFKEELRQGGDEDELRNAYRAKESAGRTSRSPGTASLSERYRWLVWLLAQPLRNREGKTTQDDDDLVRNAVGHLRTAWPTNEAAEKELLAELPLLAGDPHLAIYWLLHTSLLALEPQRARVLAAIGDTAQPTPLVEAFVNTFGSLPLDGDVPVVPGFRARRSRAVMYGGASEQQKPRIALVAMEIAPWVTPMLKFELVRRGLENGSLTESEVAAALARTGAVPSTSAVRALLDQRAGMQASEHADECARTAPATDEPWAWVFNALWHLHPLVSDTDALAGAAGYLLGKDPHHRRILVMAQRAQELAGRELFMPADELERALPLAMASGPVLEELLESPEQGPQIIDRIEDPELVRVVARRILYRGAPDGYDATVSSWAIRTVLAGTDADRGELAARGFEALPTRSRGEVLTDVSAEITSADHPFVGVMLRLLEDAHESDDADFGETYAVEKMKEEILKSLAPFAHEPQVFDELMRLAELPAGRTTIDPLWSKLFNPFNGETYVLPKLSDEQAVRVAKVMIANRLTHPSIHARNAVGHQLYRFNHVGAQEYVIEALGEYGSRFAASTKKGGQVFDHGQTEDDLLEDVVANLYSAVGNMGTPRSRTALIERLFTERREFWRMGNAIGAIFSDEVHREVLETLRNRQDGFAAGCYAFALADFVKQCPPKVELLRELVGWPMPMEEIPRRFFKYALVIGIEAALAAKSYELVRAAHALASGIAELPLDPDDHARGIRWDNPLDTGSLRKQLEAAVSGAADEKRRRLIEKGVEARNAGRPRRKISDRKLGILAGVTAARRLLHDRDSGEVWFLDTDGTVHAFDGYDIADLPFQVRPAAYGQMRAFLDGATELSERALCWDSAVNNFVELIRYGDRLTYAWSRNNYSLIESVGLVFPDAGTAADAFARLRGSVLASGMTESSPWYVPGKGAIMRSFRTPDVDGGNSSSDYLQVFDRKVDRSGQRFATEVEAITEHQRWELERQRDRNASLSCLEWRANDLRPEDMTVGEWIKDRIRDDSRGAAWHVEALTEIVDYLRSHGYGDLIGTFAVEVGSGVDDAEIAAFEAERRHPVPQVLRDFWREIGHAQWSTGGVGMRVLSPSRMLARRPAARALGEKYLQAMAPSRAESARDLLSCLDVLVETLDGEIVCTVLADADNSDGRVFTHAREDPADFWWEKSLSWMLATNFLDVFAEAVAEAAPVVAQLYHGQPLRPQAQRRRFELLPEGRTPRYWELFLDDTLGVVSTRSGKVGAVGALRTRRYDDPARAARKAAKLVAAREQEGYLEVPA